MKNKNGNRAIRSFKWLVHSGGNQVPYLRMLLLPSLVWLSSCANIFRSGWNGDDWPNSQTPYWVLWRYGELSPSSVLHEALYWNDQWMQGQGRFYLLQWVESRFIFSYLREQWQYKSVQMLVVAITGFLFAYIIYRLTLYLIN